MAEIQLGVVEARYADIIWEHEPVSSSELVKLTEEAFHWKRTTAHNVLRRLCDKGLFRNDNGTVTSLISRDEFYAMQSRQFVEDTFEGSLPAFLAAFTKDRALTAEEAAKIRSLYNILSHFMCITDIIEITFKFRALLHDFALFLVHNSISKQLHISKVSGNILNQFQIIIAAIFPFMIKRLYRNTVFMFKDGI